MFFLSSRIWYGVWNGRLGVAWHSPMTQLWVITWAETSLRLVSPFPDGWSIADELTIRSSRPKLSLTWSAAPRMSSSRFTSSLRTVSLPGCWPARPRSSAAPSGFLHVAITAAGVLVFRICLQNASPSPLLAPWMSAMGAAMTGNWRNSGGEGSIWCLHCHRKCRSLVFCGLNSWVILLKVAFRRYPNVCLFVFLSRLFIEVPIMWSHNLYF